MVTGTLPAPRTGEVQALRDRAHGAKLREANYLVEAHKKQAIAAACIVFVLIVVPAALRFPPGGVGLVVGLSIVVITIYYRGLAPKAIATSYVFSLPEKLVMVLPAAVLFATVFSIGAMGRHAELTAAKATGRSFHRIALPVFLAGVFVVVAGLGLGELAPPA